MGGVTAAVVVSALVATPKVLSYIRIYMLSFTLLTLHPAYFKYSACSMCSAFSALYSLKYYFAPA